MHRQRWVSGELRWRKAIGPLLKASLHLPKNGRRTKATESSVKD